jgi:transcriptional regulator with XRE-family HTH domain
LAKLAEVFAANVLRRLLENKLVGRCPKNQAELAAVMGISSQGVSKGLKRAPRLTTVEEFAKALKCPPWELIVDPKEVPEEGHELEVIRRRK